MGLIAVASMRVKPPRVAGVPVAYECVLRESIALGRSTWVMGDVVQVHMTPAAMRARSAASGIAWMCCRRQTCGPMRGSAAISTRGARSKRCSGAMAGSVGLSAALLPVTRRRCGHSGQWSGVAANIDVVVGLRQACRERGAIS